MKLSQLEQIIEVANTGTISQAANNLFLSQPNLSLSIKSAEDELGTKLFERTSTGMILTPTGNEFVDRAKEILQQVNALSDACRTDKALIPLELSVVSASHRIVELEITNLLKKYDQNYIKVNILNSAGTKLLDYIAENRAELGFCTVYSFSKQIMMRQVSLRKLEYYPLCSLSVGIYVGANNPRFSDADTSVDFEKIKSAPYVTLAHREFNTNTLQEHLLTHYGIMLQPRTEIVVDNVNVMRTILNLMDSYAIVARPKYSYGADVFYSDLRFIPLETDMITAELGYTQRENTVRSTLANELLRNIKQRFNTVL